MDQEQWVTEAALALWSAKVIGEREGCKLNYANLDRLVQQAKEQGWI